MNHNGNGRVFAERLAALNAAEEERHVQQRLSAEAAVLNPGAGEALHPGSDKKGVHNHNRRAQARPAAHDRASSGGRERDRRATRAQTPGPGPGLEKAQQVAGKAAQALKGAASQAEFLMLNFG